MKLLYITTNFHSLTLTFVTREINELRRSGVEIDLLSLRRKPPFASSEPACDLTGCLYLHPVSWTRILASTLKTLLRRPGAFFGAIGLIGASRQSSLKIRLKQLYQLLVSTTVLDEIIARKITHIHAHLATPPGTYAMMIAKLAGLPYSFTGHAADLYCAAEANDIKLREAAGAVAISEYNKRHYLEICPAAPRIQIIHCGVDPAEFAFRPREACHRPLRILAVGRAAEKKGFTYLLKALALLNERGVDWSCDLVGDGPLSGVLFREAAELDLDKLTIRGALQQSEIKALLATADVFILPCIQAASGDIDGIPVSLMEAMAVGCPVISTRVSGIPELVIDGETGLLADPRDPVGLADAVMRLAGDAQLQAAISAAGRAQVEAAFNQQLEAEKLKRFFTDLHGSAGQSL